MREERASESRGGLAVERAAEMRSAASFRWFESHRRRITALIWFTSSSVRAGLVVAVVKVLNCLNADSGGKKLRDELRLKKRSFSAADLMAPAAERKWSADRI